tara:strand:+ start:677 stop:1075 length:399 start_codon:yes stop_codon:yes gene_type:complete
MMEKLLSPDSIHPTFGNYSHGIEVQHIDTLVLTSGQLGISKDGAIPEKASDQARICFENIQAILEQSQLSMNDVVQLRAYVTDRDYFTDYMRIRDEFLEGRKITSTLLIVSGFTRPEFKVEVEALAIKQNSI